MVTTHKKYRGKQAMLASLIAHEAVHISQALFEGLNEDRPSSELQAYIVQHIVQQLMKDYLRQVKK